MKLSRQSLLATFGGGCLGLLVGCVLGAIAGYSVITVEAWEQHELYGFIGLARQLRGMGSGALLGGLLGLITGSWLGAKAPRDRSQSPPVSPNESSNSPETHE